MPRQVRIGAHASTAVDVRLPSAVVELVYFDDARAEAALIGSAPFHAAVLVVSGVDSVQPGTWDSIMQAREKGVRFALAVVTRCGEVEDPELVDLVKLEVGELLQKHLGDTAEIPVMGVDAQRAMAGAPPWAEAMGAVLRVLGA
jgi:elongation factor Tu